MAFTRDQKATVLGGQGTGATVSITWATNPTAGSSVVFAVGLNSSSPVTGITDNGTTPGTFTLDASNTVSSHGIWIYRCDGITLPSSGSYKVSFTVANTIFWAACGASYLGGPLGAPSATNNGSATSASVTTGAVTVPSGGMAFGAHRISLGNTTITLTGANFTTVGNDPNGSTDEAFGSADTLTSGSQTCTWTDGSSALYNAAIAAYGPVSGPSGGARRTPYRTPMLPPVRRARQMLPVPAQLNPPYPFAEIVQRRQTWPRGLPHRGRVTFVVPPQINPPYPWAEITQHRDTWPKAWPRRGRVLPPVPPQVNPPYPWAEVRQWRQPRGLWPRRGHQFTPVPSQQTAPTAVFVPQAERRARLMAAPRRGKVTTPPLSQPDVMFQRAPVRPRPAPQRRRALPQAVPAQPAVAPAWVQGHRAPARAIALLRRRFRQLMPWPQQTAPQAGQGIATIVNTYSATATIVNTYSATATIANTLSADAEISNTYSATATISNSYAGTATIVNDL